ncbi:heme-binding beta-barrel domain-containing protein [uncultured Actinomyces sp.]|uniref:FABP family protein n=1 Tax=uncultured Actinomyces sp. TaxID=249061 RepID=UPI002889EA96|nr:heme-binding beta-barrel domain-containing protein [uncultured Actinomyces sp.]
MTFSIPDDLAPELYPLAWLVGTWRGYGILTYGRTVPEQAVAQEMTFDHDGGPYLRQVTTIWTLDATRSSDLDFDTPGLEGFARIAPARIWSTETAYWRPVGQEEPDGEGADADGPGAASAGDPGGAGAPGPDGAGTDGPGSLGGGAASAPDPGSASADRPGGPRPRTAPRTRLELVSADPAGHVAVWEGWIRGPRARIATQAVGRTRTAVPLTQMNRMFGLVGGDLMWTQDMAAFGETEPKTYASGRLGRVQGPDAAGIAVPAGTATAEAPVASAAAVAEASPANPAAAGADAPSAPDAPAASAEADRKAQS